MKTISVNVVESGEKLLECKVCGDKVDHTEVMSGCCEPCIWVWSEVCRLMSQGKDGGK